MNLIFLKNKVIFFFFLSKNYIRSILGFQFFFSLLKSPSVINYKHGMST